MSNEVRIKITTDQKGAEKNVQSLNKSFGGLNTSLGSAGNQFENRLPHDPFFNTPFVYLIRIQNQ